MNETNERPEVRVKPCDCQPGKAEREELLRIDATPDEVIRAAFRQVKVVDDA